MERSFRRLFCARLAADRWIFHANVERKKPDPGCIGRFFQNQKLADGWIGRFFKNQKGHPTPAQLHRVV